jgi:hypothetical protein
MLAEIPHIVPRERVKAMFSKKLGFRKVALTLAALTISIIWSSTGEAGVFEAPVNIADVFAVAPLDLSGVISLAGAPDGLMGGVAWIPGGIQAFGIPAFSAADFTPIGVLPNAWPTVDPIVFAGAFEFEVNVGGIVGSPSAILAGVPHKVTITSNFDAVAPGLADITADLSFSTQAVSLFAIPASGWVAGSGSVAGTITPLVGPPIPFNETFDGWAAGFLADGAIFGALGIITTQSIPSLPVGDIAAEIVDGEALLRAVPIPEPSTLALFSLATFGWIGYSLRRRRKAFAE